MHRSGTSAITRALTALGVDLGEKLLPANKYNDKGYFEDSDFVNINELLLRKLSSSWDSPPVELITDIDDCFFEDERHQARLLLDERLSKANCFGIKDPRFSVLLPFWQRIFDDLDINVSYVIALRNPLSVAASLQKRDHIFTMRGLLLWTAYTLSAVYLTANKTRIFVEFDQITSDPRGQLKRLETFLPFKQKNNNSAAIDDYVNNFLESDLNHHHFNLNDLITDPKLPSITKTLYQSLLYNTDNPELTPSAGGHLQQIIMDYKQCAWALSQLCEIDKTLTTKTTKINNLITHIDNLKRIRSALEFQQVDLNSTNRDLKQEIERTHCEINSLAARVHNIEASLSWRITAPLRRIRSTLNRMKFSLNPSLISKARRVWLYLPLNPGKKHRIKQFILSVIRVLRIRENRSSPSIFSRFPYRPLKSSQNNKYNHFSLNESPQISMNWPERLKLLSRLGNCNDPCDELTSEMRIELLSDLPARPPLVSVIIPTWNRETSICRAVDSALTQSYPYLEILVCDDGSTDDTLKTIRAHYAQEIDNGRLIVLENDHRGVSAARNSGLNAANGNLIAYLDSDNAWRSDYLLTMTSLFTRSDELMVAYAALEGHIDGEPTFRRAVDFSRKRLIQSNFIDLNIFMHRHQLYRQHGGFDENLRRLVDWDLIVRYTRHHEPAFAPFIGVDYFLDQKRLNNITYTESLNDNIARVYLKTFQERIKRGNEPLRLAYVIWDFPALSQTFVMNELRWLVGQGIDTKVYYKIAPEKSVGLDFKIASEQIDSAEGLAKVLVRDQRNLCHSHFAYPAVTLLTHPACLAVGIHYTFMPHAVDIFHNENRKRNQIAEISNHPLCLRVFVYGNYHRNFLIDNGVRPEKIAFNMQAVDLEKFQRVREQSPTSLRKNIAPCRAIVIARFIEKKGVEYLIEAANILANDNIFFDIYGYGPLHQKYEAMISRLGITNIHFKGVIQSPSELVAAYDAADMLLVPSVIAENGDMDGFPTVIMEAMAASVPVIVTNVSAVSDYVIDGIGAIVIPQKDVNALVSAIHLLMDMSPSRRLSMVNNAKQFVTLRTGTSNSMRMLMDTWCSRTVDIFMVTFNAPGHDDRESTFEIIRRIFLYTTTPFILTIIDNQSSPDFIRELEALIQGRDNVRLIQNSKNIFCGPASNIALGVSESEYSIYLCSKEAFIGCPGWERSMIRAMDDDHDVAIAGHLVHTPKYVFGHEYCLHPEFLKFRNQDFAAKNPAHQFRHVQGGIYILRKIDFLTHGGFNENLPHNYMDVEYSYFLESRGRRLADLPEVASVTTKTRPPLHSIIDENTTVAHPLTAETARTFFDPLVNRLHVLCNICGWHGTTFLPNDSEFAEEKICAQCSSTEAGRSLFRMLASDYRVHRHENLSLLSGDASLSAALDSMFSVLYSGVKFSDFSRTLKSKTLSCLVVESKLLLRNDGEFWRLLLQSLQINGMLLLIDYPSSDTQKTTGREISSKNISTISNLIDSTDGEFIFSHESRNSNQVGYDWRPIFKVIRLAPTHQKITIGA